MDHCLENGVIVGEKKEIIEKFIADANTYFEFSPSGTGIHGYLIIKEALQLEKNKNEPFEVYTSGRYFTVTNKPFGESREIRTITIDEANKLLSIIGYPWKKEEKEQKNIIAIPISLDDETLLSKMFSSKNGNKIKSLFDGDITQYGNDDSSADMALCSHLAFWTGRNSGQMERIWLSSPLGTRGKTRNRKDYRNMTINKAVNGCSEIYSNQKSNILEKNEESKDNSLLNELCGRKDVTLFHDEQKETYIALDISGHREIWPCKSKSMKIYLASKTYEKNKKTLGQEQTKNNIAVLEGKAHFEGPEIKLQNRTAWHEDSLWYDLTNRNWQAIKITKNKWEIVDRPPLIFKRYSHNQPQVIPDQYGDVKLFLNYVNITNPEHRLLALVFLVSCFIPDFPHVMLVIFGAQGSSKSTFSKLTRLVVDPSMIEVASFPQKQNELIQALAHHNLLFFDNVSHISEEQSDILCKAITGGGHTKRVLFENDEDIIYSFMRCIGINGINLVTTRPDLLERSLLLELERIEPSERKTEKELYENFRKDLPVILGGILDVLVKTLQKQPTIKLDSHHRMADWTLWGCAIAEALGYTKEEFLNAYQNNINKQTETLINENIVATAIITFMEGKNNWEDTPTKLLQELSTHAFLENIDTTEKYWPKGSNILARRLNELGPYLKQMGLLVTKNTNGLERHIVIKRIKKDTKKTTDDTDGIDGVLKAPTQLTVN
jgi:hypothetical protein